MIRTHVIEQASDLDRIQGLWNALLRGNPERTIFQSFESNRRAAETFSERERLHVVVAEAENGAAIIPAVIRSDETIALIGETLFDYRDVLFQGDDSVLRAAWAELATLGLPFELTALRGQGVAERWREFNLQPFCNAPYLSRAALDHDAFLQAHSRLGSRARKIARREIELRRSNGGDSELVSRIYELKAQHNTHGENIFADSLRRDFMVEICRLHRDHCDIYTYVSGSDIVAAIVTFRSRSTRHCYTVYYDPRWATLSPGQVLLFELSAETLRDGMDCDFMTGEYPYKNRIATEQVPLFRVQVSAEHLLQVAEGRTLPEPEVAA